MDIRFVVTIQDCDPVHRVKPEDIEYTIDQLLENLEVDGNVVAFQDNELWWKVDHRSRIAPTDT